MWHLILLLLWLESGALDGENQLCRVFISSGKQQQVLFYFLMCFVILFNFCIFFCETWLADSTGRFFWSFLFFFTSAPCFSLVDGWVSTVAAEFIFFVFSFLCLYILHLLIGLFLCFFPSFCVFCLCRLAGWRVSTAAAKFIDQTFLSPSSCYQIKELRHR